MPLVPGSGREVPPWVIAGPVLRRLGELLDSMRRGYRDAEEVLQRPRGRILWNRYRNESLVRGRWHQLPCRFPDGRELDGLAWQLPLDRAWEAYVEAIVREEVARTGGQVKVARLRQTVFPILWSDPIHRSLGHLEPDIVVHRGRDVHIVDAKYKAHLAELDEHGWRRFTDEARERHRADLHQVLAYASLFDADRVRSTLMYPLRKATYRASPRDVRQRRAGELVWS